MRGFIPRTRFHAKNGTVSVIVITAIGRSVRQDLFDVFSTEHQVESFILECQSCIISRPVLIAIDIKMFWSYECLFIIFVLFDILKVFGKIAFAIGYMTHLPIGIVKRSPDEKVDVQEL